jgi:hypothetical protein
MKILTEYTNIEFSSADNNEIPFILEKYRLSKIIDDTIQLLKNTHNQISDISTISCCLLTTINHNISAVKKHDQKSKIEVLLADLIFEIYISFLNKSSFDAEKIIEEIIKSSTVTCNLCAYDFNVFKKLIDFYKLDSIIKHSNKNNFLKTSTDVDRKKCKLIWNGKGRLEELIYQLQKRKLIKAKLNFFNLFIDEHAENTVVKWDFERKGHLAYLLYQLHAQNLIRLVSCKGYFIYAEMHFIGFDDKTLKKDSLKKLSSAMNNEPSKYRHIINEVDDIIKSILPHKAVDMKEINADD